jgi:hypothetical protein
MDLVPGARKLGAVEAAHRPAADHRDLHKPNKKGTLRAPECL